MRSAADSARAAQLVAEMRRTLARYRDVRVAEAQGFRQLLLYREEPGGPFELVGAMYTAPARTTADELDRRIPLSVALARARELVLAPARRGRPLARAAQRPRRIRAPVPARR